MILSVDYYGAVVQEKNNIESLLLKTAIFDGEATTGISVEDWISSICVSESQISEALVRYNEVVSKFTSW